MSKNFRFLNFFSLLFQTHRIKKVFFSVFAIGVVISSLSSWYVYQQNQTRVQSYIESLSVEIEELVKKRFEHYEYGLKSVKGLVFGSGIANLNRATFKSYIESSNLPVEFPGARGFGFIRRVPLAFESQYIEQVIADDALDFSIRTFTPHNKDRFIIEYIYPVNKNDGATGLDIGSEKMRRMAALESAEDGNTKLTAPITLVQAEGKKRRGFLLLLPIYDKVLPFNSANNKINNTLGWAYAPLVVDEVLAELGISQKGARLTITDEIESRPFYESAESPNIQFIYSTHTEKNIEFMGRKWFLHIDSLPPIAEILGLWSPVWIGLLSLLIVTLLGFIIWLGLITKKSEDQYISRIDIRSFFKSLAVKKLLLAYFLLIIIFIVIIAFLRFPEQIQEKSKSLLSLVHQSHNILERNNQEYKEDLIFLSSTSPLNGLINSIKNKENSIPSPLLHEWKLRLIEIFKAYIISSPNVYQVRLIQQTRNGYEIVRVERRGEAIYVVPEAELQFKGDRPYVANAIELERGEVLLSDIELNKENNALELPHRPTYRYSSPVFDYQGILFGVVIINVDAKKLLAELNKLPLSDEVLYVTNSTGDFIIHPDNSKLFGTDIGSPFKWEDEFRPSSLPFDKENINTAIWKGELGNILIATDQFIPHNKKNSGRVEFKATSLISFLYQKNLLMLATFFAILLGIGLLVTVFMYVNWAKLQRARQEDYLITQRKKDKMFESLIELSPDALIITNSEGVIEIINSQTEKLFKYKRAEMLGQHINVFIPKFNTKSHDVTVAGSDSVLQFNQANYTDSTKLKHLPNDVEIFGLNVQGKEFPIEMSISPVQVEEKLLFAASIRNISERKLVEDTLRAASIEAQRANKAKSSFLANMSHEIRTPLNAVIGLTYLLRDQKLTEEQMDLVVKVQLSGRSLLGIVNDVLDLAQIEADEVNVNLTPCRIKELVNELLSVFTPQAEQKGLTLNVEMSPEVPVWIMTDEKLIRQMLTNLLGNAIKFTNQGHVLLNVLYHDCVGNSVNRSILFEVSDTGIGITSHSQKKLFQPFSQADESSNRKFGGTGLGLSIVRNMITLLGGEIKLKSIPDKGSKFSLFLPFTEPTEEDLEVYEDKGEMLNVLIAEDDVNQQLQLINDCEALGWNVNAVNNGSELLSVIKESFDSGQSLPDVLLVDWQMPELDGLQALSLITKEIGITNLPAVLVVSAFESEKIIQLYPDKVIDHILKKPVKLPELFNAVNNVIVKQTGNNERVFESTQPETTKAKWLLNVNVLVVDDSNINLEVVGNILERNGAIANKVSSGSAAIDYLKSTDSVDIVLMDIQMPDMDGLETTQYIRNELKLNMLPIVALTAGTLMEEKRKSLDAGMNDFLTKPIEPPKLIRVMRKLVESYRNRVILLESIHKEDTQSNPDWPIIDGLIHDNNLLDGDLALLVSIMERVFSEHENLLNNSSIDQLATNEDRIILANKVHKLRGSLGLIGAQELFKIAGDTEIGLRLDNDDATRLMKSLRQNFIKLHNNCQEFLSQYHHDNKNPKQNNLPSSPNILPVSEAEINEITALLQSNDIQAVQFLNDNTNALKAFMQMEDFTTFKNLINQLNFKDALNLLNTNILSANNGK